MDPIKPAYAGEAMLIRWGENHNGRTVTLQLDPNIGDVHPFKGLRGGLNGQRMQLAAVLIGDDEQPVPPIKLSSAPQGAPEGPTPEKRERKRSEIAALRLKDFSFVEWLDENHGKLTDKSEDEMLKRVLGIASKKELDTDPFKAAEFDKLITSFAVRNYQVR